MNRYNPHIIVAPEDRANSEVANGFILHDAVAQRSILVSPWAGGWSAVLALLRNEYIGYLERYPRAHVVLLIDFDKRNDRRARFEQEVPDPIKDRVFIIGSRGEPEDVRRDAGETFEKIGHRLADECFREHYELWDSPHFDHNAGERARLATTVKSIAFAS